MDFVSHALWGGIAFGRRSRGMFTIAVAVSLMPDILTEGLFGVLFLLDIGSMPSWEYGHPNITDYPLWARYLYNFTHSLVMFTFIYVLVWVLTRKPVWVIGAWGLHILIDIPTHSLELFPTPFLWPISDYKFNGVNWHRPVIFSINLVLLFGVYLLWWRQRKQN